MPPRKKCGVVMDVCGNHLLHREHESCRIWKHAAQIQLLFMDLAKAARHPIVEPRPKGQHRQRPDIKALGSQGGTTLFDIAISHPLSSARLANAPREANTFASSECGMGGNGCSP